MNESLIPIQLMTEAFDEERLREIDLEMERRVNETIQSLNDYKTESGDKPKPIQMIKRHTTEQVIKDNVRTLAAIVNDYTIKRGPFPKYFKRATKGLELLKGLTYLIMQEELSRSIELGQKEIFVRNPYIKTRSVERGLQPNEIHLDGYGVLPIDIPHQHRVIYLTPSATFLRPTNASKEIHVQFIGDGSTLLKRESFLKRFSVPSTYFNNHERLLKDIKRETVERLAKENKAMKDYYVHEVIEAVEGLDGDVTFINEPTDRLTENPLLSAQQNIYNYITSRKEDNK